MMRALCSVLILFLAGASAHAGLSQSQLDTVFVDAKPDAAIDVGLPFSDETGHALSLGRALNGKPGIVVFTDYTCRNICGPVLAFAADGLTKSGLTPGKDFHLIAIGIDPKDKPTDAQAMKASRIGTATPLADATLMLTGAAGAVTSATVAAGYHYTYDRENDQFAHPAVAYVVTAQGHISRVLSGLGLSGPDLRLALIDAGRGDVGTFADRIRLLCYCFDPATGIYSASIARLLAAFCTVTVILLAGGIGLLTFRSRRRARA